MSILNSILQKIKKTIIGDTLSTFVKYKNYISPKNSTVLLTNSNIVFNTNELEKRIYLSIGEKGLIKATFIFETEKGQVTIGNNVHLGGVTFISRNSIIIKDDVTMAWDITIYDHNSHSINWDERKEDNTNCFNSYHKLNGNNIANKNWTNVKDAPIIIESKVWIGFGVAILKGVTIGEGAVVGAKSVVTKDVPAWSVVAGNPAKIVKQLQSHE